MFLQVCEACGQGGAFWHVGVNALTLEYIKTLAHLFRFTCGNVTLVVNISSHHQIQATFSVRAPKQSISLTPDVLCLAQ